MYIVATFLKIIVLPNSKLKRIVSIVGSYANIAKKWQISEPNQNNFKILGELVRSSTHTSLDCVNNSARNISG
jgi:hypothetical protein